MRSNSVQTFGTSFLDLLSCGMGAVVLLCLIFAASKKGGGDFEGDAAFISIEVEGGRVGLRYKPDDGPALAPGERSASSSSMIVEPNLSGARAYQLVVDEARSKRDSLLLFIYESDFQPGRAELTVKIMSESKAGTATHEIKLPNNPSSLPFVEHKLNYFLTP